jgi:hypothetical protein
MSEAVALDQQTAGLCHACGIPLDSQYFDDSSVQPTPGLGQEIVLARFDLPAQYCGVLQYFAQFTEAFAGNAFKIDTPEIEWKLLVNNHALFPYINLRHIVNPWGVGSYPLNIRLDENSSIEFVVRGLAVPQDPVSQVAGRIMGRFWYNASYGGREHSHY